MHSFLKNIFTFSVFFTFLFILGSNDFQIFSNYTMLAYRKEAIINKINGEKVIITGGSNVAFGINSKNLELEFKYPVINMGIHAQLGFNFIRQQAFHHLKDQDIILISLEFEMPLENNYITRHRLKSLPYVSLTFFEHIKSRIQLLRNNIIDLKDIIIGREDVFRNALNENGDFIRHLSKKPSHYSNFNTVDYKFNYKNLLTAVNSLNNDLTKRNIKLFYIYPPLMKSTFNRNQLEIEKVISNFEENANFIIPLTILDCVFEDSLFYDSPYHLHSIGRELRTQRIINECRKYILK